MTRRNDNAAEIAYLVARCRLIVDAIEAEEPGFTGGAPIREAIELAARQGNVRGLRTVRSDLLDMSRALPAPARRALEAQLDAQAAADPFGRAAS